MEFISWVEEYSVNVREIDHQHKKLLEIINKLHDGILAVNYDFTLTEVLDELVNYTVYHFGFEENLLVRSGYQKVTKHFSMHSEFIDKLKDYLRKHQSGEISITEDLMSFLKDWLVNHIMHTDKEYSSFLNSKGIT